MNKCLIGTWKQSSLDALSCTFEFLAFTGINEPLWEKDVANDMKGITLGI